MFRKLFGKKDHKTSNVSSAAALYVRPLVDEDAARALQIHYEAVHCSAAAFYPEEKLDRWSPPLHEDSVEDFLCNPDDEIRLVAERAGDVLGFACLVLPQNELRACYVCPRHEGQGVGRALIDYMEALARGHKLEYLQLASSLNAEGFYKACGYKTLFYGEHALRGGETLPCVYMRKDLAG